MLRRRPALPRIYLPLLILVLIGIGLRAWVAAAFSPAILNSADTDNYLLYAHTSLFSDPIHPAGYLLYLKVVGWVSSTAAPPIVLQHIIGVVTGLLAYATTVRVGAPRWVGAIPAGFVLLSLDQVALEHQYMPETLFTFLIVATVYCGVRGVMSARAAGRLAWPAAGWLAGAGVMLGLAAYVRTVALPMAPFLALWALLALPKPWLRSRVAGASVALGAVIVLALAYSVAHQIKSDYFGFVPGNGWAVYVRTAQFADCTKFTPPPGTRALCESTPSDARPGPDFYAWEAASPARRLFGRQPYGGDELGAFGREAILHQPFAYLETVFNDTVRTFAPGYNADRLASGPGFDVLDINRRELGLEKAIMRSVDRWYGTSTLEVREGPARSLHDLQQLLRVQGIILLQLVILAIVGLFAARGAMRGAIALLFGGAALLLIIPPVTVVFNPRYTIPAVPLLAGAAALAAWALWQRASRRLVSDRGPAPDAIEREPGRETAGVA